MPILVDGAAVRAGDPVDAAPYDFYTVSRAEMAVRPRFDGRAVRPRPGARLTSHCRRTSRRTATRPARTRRRRSGPVRRGLDPDAVARRARGRARRRSRTGRRTTRRRSPARCWTLLSERFTVVTAPGQANLVSFVADGDAAEVAARLSGQGVLIRDMPGTGLAARLLRLVDERRRPRPAPRRPVGESLKEVGGASGRFLHREASRRPARSLRPGRRRRGQTPRRPFTPTSS